MKKLRKAILIILAFVICYMGIMVVAYDYLYPYPTGALDTIEREDDALFYGVVRQVDINSDTILYFSRSSNGSGTSLHVGTLKSSVPEIIGNLFYESTSSYYLPINTISYGRISDTGEYYLFGATSDLNTVRVVITFYVGDSEETYKVYEMDFEDQTFYYLGFDPSDADYSCRVVGYNDSEGITFSYNGDPISVGEYTPD